MSDVAAAAARTQISEKLLNEKIMALLVARPGCTDARSIMLELVETAGADNWRIGHFDPGQGDRYRCKVALRTIQGTLVGQYEMIGRS